MNKKNFDMILGAAPVSGVAPIIGQHVTFGVGAYNHESDTYAAIKAKDDDDAKVRFVYDEDSESGAIFVGNKLVSSRILNVVPVTETKQVFDETTGEWVDTADVTVKQIAVTYIGKNADGVDGYYTEVIDIIDKDSVAEMIKELRHDVENNADVLTDRVEDVEDLLSSDDFINEAVGGALDVSKHVDPSTGFITYEYGVKVDGETVKVVDDKLIVSTYSMDKLEEGEEGYSANWASQYRMTKTTNGVTEYIGDTINIAKDFLLKSGHVCNFGYLSENGEELVLGTEQVWPDGVARTFNEGDDMVAEALPWAKYQTKTGEEAWEQAVMGQNLKYGHVYLHLVLNTRNDDELDVEDVDTNLQTDVFLDFTEIFGEFKTGDQYIKYDNGVITLDIENVMETIDASLGITDKFAQLDSSLDDIENHLDTVDSSVNRLEEYIDALDASTGDLLDNVFEHLDDLDSSVDRLDASVTLIENSYIADASVVEQTLDSSQFDRVELYTKKDGVDGVVSFEIANDKFYGALNHSIDVLAANDNYFSQLLSWNTLD